MIDQLYAAWPFLAECTLTDLPGEYDRNFAVYRDGEFTHVLKVMRSDADPQLIAVQIDAISRCVATGIPTGAVVPTIGDLATTIVSEAGQTHLAWMIDACPGRALDDLVDYPDTLVAEIAALIPSIHEALAPIDNAILDRPIKWNMQHADWVADAASVIEDAGRRELVAGIVEHHIERVQPTLRDMPQVPVHNDLNPNNLFASPACVGAWTVSAVIDFGDMVRGARLIDYAILGAYLFARTDRPIDLLCTFVASADEHAAFTDVELANLLPLIQMRLATSVVNSAQMKLERPDDPYVVVSEKQSWQLLEALSTVDPEVALAQMRVACGRPATPTSAQILQYLAELNAPSPILPTLDVAGGAVLDLSVTGSTIPRNPFGDPIGTSFELGAPGSRGGWGEPRLIYNGETQVEQSPNGRRRTVHLGVDVTGPAGAPVHAPLSGVVAAVEARPDLYDYGAVVILEHTTSDGHTFWTLFGHLSYDSISVRDGERVEAGSQIAELGTPEQNGGWPPHLHLQAAVTRAGFGTDWPGACDPDEWDSWAEIFPNPAALLGLPNDAVAYDAPSTSELAAARHTRLGSNLSVSYDEPLQAARGWKHTIFDDRGRPHLDAYNNVPHVGHAHPRIAKVATQQLQRINTNSRYLSALRMDFADALTSRLPDELDTCFFVNSGSEANEVALRMAEAWHRAHTGESGDTIVQEWGYHGITTGTIDISHYKFARSGGTGAPDHVRVLDVPDTYRGAFLRDDPEAGSKYASQVEAHIAAASDRGRSISSFIAESFPSVGGQHVPPDGYLAGVYERVHAAGGLCIADEVQTGLGRLGDHYWGFEQQSVVPDIVVLGKPLGNGHPIAAVITTAEIAERFSTGMEFFSTFGGSTLSCAVGLEVLQIIDDENLQQNAATVGGHLLKRLAALTETHPGVGDARGMGLFLGVELVTDPVSKTPDTARAAFIKNELRHDRILIGTDGPDDNVLKIRPPLTFDIESADHLVNRIDHHLSRSAR